MEQTRREFCGWLASMPIVALGAGGVIASLLASCADRGDGKKQYPRETPLGEMQARGFGVTPGAYTDPTARGTYVVRVSGQPVQTYDVDGFMPSVAADELDLTRFGGWRKITWYNIGVPVVTVQR